MCDGGGDVETAPEDLAGGGGGELPPPVVLLLLLIMGCTAASVCIKNATTLVMYGERN